MSEWPFSSYLGPIGALPTAPRLARGFVFVVLNGWGLPESVDTLELISSELATNVVQAATGPDGRPRYDEEGRLHLMWLRLLSDRSKVMLEVWDNLPEVLGAPMPHHASDDEESGRGLEMVEMLTEDWGWEKVKGWTGKRVWALLSAIDKEDQLAAITRKISDGISPMSISRYRNIVATCTNCNRTRLAGQYSS